MTSSSPSPSAFNLSSPAAASAAGDNGTETLKTLIDSLAIIFFVTGLGYATVVTGFIPRNANKGIGPMIGKVCLPLLIFRNVAKLDLSAVEWGVVGCCGLVKICSFLLALCVGYFTRPPKGQAKSGDLASQLGIFTLFCTGSNDLAMGLAIIESLYPASATPIDLGALTFVVVGMQVAIIAIPSFVMLETSKVLRANSKKTDSRGNHPSSKLKIAKVIAFNLARNPIIIATFVGLFYTLVNPPTPGDRTSHKNIPELVDKMFAKAGSAFGMAALFLGGMAVVGKFKLLRGKRLLLPIVMSLIKVLVAPILGFYITQLAYSGSGHQRLFSEYVFIYSSLPTAGSIIVFAQNYDVPTKDMISGAAVLVLLMFVPIMFTAATLLVGGNLTETGISDAMQFLSLLGCLLLSFTACISSEWRTYPKVGVVQLGIASVIFASAHIGCYNSLQMLATQWGGTDMNWAMVTLFGRLWRRLLYSVVLGLDLLLIHWRGIRTARRVFPFSSVFVVLFAAVSAISWYTSHAEVISRYPCWYNFGSSQIEYDTGIMCFEVLLTTAIMSVVLTTNPAAADDTPHLKVHETVKQSGGVEMGAAAPATTEKSIRVIVESPTMHMSDPAKCGITGGYMYRAKLVMGIHLVSLIIQIIGARTALKASEGGIIENNKDTSLSSPILAFIQIINIVCVDGKGFVATLAFISMKRNGWVLLFQRVKKWYQGVLQRVQRYRSLSRGRSSSAASDMVTEAPLLLHRLTHRLAGDETLLQARQRNGKHFAKSVSGAEFLDYLIRHHYAADRPEALELATELFDHDLIYHVTHDHEFQDSTTLLYTMHAPKQQPWSSLFTPGVDVGVENPMSRASDMSSTKD